MFYFHAFLAFRDLLFPLKNEGKTKKLDAGCSEQNSGIRVPQYYKFLNVYVHRNGSLRCLFRLSGVVMNWRGRADVVDFI